MAVDSDFTRRVTWRSDNGFEAEFYLRPCMLRDLTDTLGADAQVVKAPGQDGATTYRVTLGRPTVNLMGSIHADGFGTPLEDREQLDALETRVFWQRSAA